jgi:hypothetical protein
MTKDEALRLALDALEGADEIDCDMRDAITAIKSALEAKDEPVAWYDSVSGWTDFHSFKPTRKPSSPSAEWLPLYTTPLHRKPLTDEEAKDLLKHSDLLDMFEHIGWYSAPKNGFNKHGISLIRAIEAAHGIKGEA